VKLSFDIKQKNIPKSIGIVINSCIEENVSSKDVLDLMRICFIDMYKWTNVSKANDSLIVSNLVIYESSMKSNSIMPPYPSSSTRQRGVSKSESILSSVEKAASNGNSEAISSLLNDVSIIGEEINLSKALKISVSKGNKSCVKAILDNTTNFSSMYLENEGSILHIACAKGFISTIEEIIDGLPKKDALSLINSSDKKGNTPLHIACEHNYNDIVDYLIDFGAIVTSVNSIGESPLSISIKNKNKYIKAKILKKHPHDEKCCCVS
jgi:ankyrin repeat protein